MRVVSIQSVFTRLSDSKSRLGRSMNYLIIGFSLVSCLTMIACKPRAGGGRWTPRPTSTGFPKSPYQRYEAKPVQRVTFDSVTPSGTPIDPSQWGLFSFNEGLRITLVGKNFTRDRDHLWIYTVENREFLGACRDVAFVDSTHMTCMIPAHVFQSFHNQTSLEIIIEMFSLDVGPNPSIRVTYPIVSRSLPTAGRENLSAPTQSQPMKSIWVLRPGPVRLTSGSPSLVHGFLIHLLGQNLERSDADNIQIYSGTNYVGQCIEPNWQNSVHMSCYIPEYIFNDHPDGNYTVKLGLSDAYLGAHPGQEVSFAVQFNISFSEPSNHQFGQQSSVPAPRVGVLAPPVAVRTPVYYQAPTQELLIPTPEQKAQWVRQAEVRAVGFQERLETVTSQMNWGATETIMSGSSVRAFLSAVIKLDHRYPEAIPNSVAVFSLARTLVTNFNVGARPHGAAIQSAALRFLDRAGRRNEFIDMFGAGVKDIMALSWYAIHDESIFNLEARENLKWEMLKSFATIQRAHNDHADGTIEYDQRISPDRPSCVPGTYIRLVEHLFDVHPDTPSPLSDTDVLVIIRDKHIALFATLSVQEREGIQRSFQERRGSEFSNYLMQLRYTVSNDVPMITTALFNSLTSVRETIEALFNIE